MKILVADDDPTSRLIVHGALQRLGHECEIVANGDLAWGAFQLSSPDVIISDWMMPGLTGLQLCRRIRGDTRGRYTYLILVSSRGAREQVREGMTAGADDYLTKPLDTEELHIRLIAAARVTALHRELADQRSDLEGMNLELAGLARRDPLTGLGNGSSLHEDFEILEARAVRYGHRYCIAMLDVDSFKTYNDSYGHQAGDAVLSAIGAELKRQVRGGDALYRYGGEEFLCILPEQTLANGLVATERMRISVERLAIAHGSNSAGVVTVSAGVATLDPGNGRSTLDVLKEADEALEQAKQRGGNRVEHRTSALS